MKHVVPPKVRVPILGTFAGIPKAEAQFCADCLQVFPIPYIELEGELVTEPVAAVGQVCRLHLPDVNPLIRCVAHRDRFAKANVPHADRSFDFILLDEMTTLQEDLLLVNTLQEIRQVPRGVEGGEEGSLSEGGGGFFS